MKPRSRILAILAATAIVVASIGVIAWRWQAGSAKDPRAYDADSGEIALDAALRRAAVLVPECMLKDLRYALISDGSDYHYRIYLRATTTESCADQFLAANSMRGILQVDRVGRADTEKPLSYRPAWMSKPVITEMGWKLGSGQRFQEFGATTTETYPVTALIQHAEGSTITMYAYAFHGG